MLMPSIFRENLFDDWFDFPDFRDLDRTERKLYGKSNQSSNKFSLKILGININHSSFYSIIISLMLHEQWDGVSRAHRGSKLLAHRARDGLDR